MTVTITREMITHSASSTIGCHTLKPVSAPRLEAQLRALATTRLGRGEIAQTLLKNRTGADQATRACWQAYVDIAGGKIAATFKYGDAAVEPLARILRSGVEDEPVLTDRYSPSRLTRKRSAAIHAILALENIPGEKSLAVLMALLDESRGLVKNALRMALALRGVKVPRRDSCQSFSPPIIP
jgi:hypothetical protein